MRIALASLVSVALSACAAARSSTHVMPAHAPRIVAIEDPALSARVVRCEPLVYSDEAPLELDRPPHVRAASGIARVGDELYVVQDDAAFLGVRRADGRVEAIVLPAGPGARRRFETALGNKMDKPDLEAIVAIEGRVLGFGSGSHANRERIAIYDLVRRDVRVFDASALYARLRADRRFSGSELNVEGAMVDGGTLRLFQRGNGAMRDGVEAVNATVDLDLQALVRWIDGSGPVPELANVRQYDLGSERGVAFGFTDATSLDGRVLYIAGAEDSPDVIEDGEVLGARIGVIDGDRARWTALLDADGRPSVAKIEGVARASADRLYVVVDPDDPERPAGLCEVVIAGPW